MEINFLVGSGISIPSKAPNVQEITEKLLEGKWQKQGNTYVEANGSDHENDPRVKSIQILLKHIQEKYSNDNHLLNYEELFYAISCFKGYYIDSFYNFIFRTEYKYFESFYDNGHKPDKWYDFTMALNEITVFFQSAISHLLYKHEGITGFEIFKEIHESDVTTCNIFTLNHDLILEKYFTDNGMTFNSGFNERDGDVYLFNFDSLKEGKPKFRVIKLHGSIDWYSFPQLKGPIKQTRYGISKSGSIVSLKDKNGNPYQPVFDYPTFLSGTLNKVVDYSNSTFFELRNFFFSKLELADHLFVSGYGWRDEGIDKVVYNWLNEREANKIHFLYQNVQNETDFRNFEFFNSRNQISNYKKYLNSVN